MTVNWLHFYFVSKFVSKGNVTHSFNDNHSNYVGAEIRYILCSVLCLIYSAEELLNKKKCH